jgi:surfactin synthase thioesterase subunit
MNSCPQNLTMIPLECPGRGNRLGEPFLKDMNLLVEDLYFKVKNKLDGNKYGLYGHSMGGLLSILLARKIIEQKHKPPSHIIISGTTGPSAPSRGMKKKHLLNKKEFIDEIKKLDGLPQEILQNQDMVDFIEPILRSDFQASENYVHKEMPPLPIPITVIMGSEEDVEIEDVLLWQRESIFNVSFKELPGKHFFILEYHKEIIEIIAQQLN